MFQGSKELKVAAEAQVSYHLSRFSRVKRPGLCRLAVRIPAQCSFSAVLSVTLMSVAVLLFSHSG